MASQCQLPGLVVLSLRGLRPESIAPRRARHSAWICLSCGRSGEPWARSRSIVVTNRLSRWASQPVGGLFLVLLSQHRRQACK